MRVFGIYAGCETRILQEFSRQNPGFRMKLELNSRFILTSDYFCKDGLEHETALI